MSIFFSNSKSPRKFEYITTVNNYPLQFQGKWKNFTPQKPKRQNPLGMWNIGYDESFNDSDYLRNKTLSKHADNPNKKVDSFRILLPERNVIFVKLSYV